MLMPILDARHLTGFFRPSHPARGSGSARTAAGPPLVAGAGSTGLPGIPCWPGAGAPTRAPAVSPRRARAPPAGSAPLVWGGGVGSTGGAEAGRGAGVQGRDRRQHGWRAAAVRPKMVLEVCARVLIVAHLLQSGSKVHTSAIRHLGVPGVLLRTPGARYHLSQKQIRVCSSLA